MRMQILVGVSVVLLALGTALMFTKPELIIKPVFSGAFMFSVGVFFLAVSLMELRDIREGKVKWDERKEEIQVRAGYRAFQAFAIISGPLIALLALTNIDVSPYTLLGLLFAAVMLTYAFCHYWYGRKM